MRHQDTISPKKLYVKLRQREGRVKPLTVGPQFDQASSIYTTLWHYMEVIHKITDSLFWYHIWQPKAENQALYFSLLPSLNHLLHLQQDFHSPREPDSFLKQVHPVIE